MVEDPYFTEVSFTFTSLSLTVSLASDSLSPSSHHPSHSILTFIRFRFEQPGFEKQIGTPEVTAASELYNERTLVLTRTFVKRACEYPPSGFEREINAYYYSGLPSTPPTPGALKGIVEQCGNLLEESEKWLVEKEGDGEGEGDNVKPPQSLVVPSQRVLTEGAGLSLKRTLKGLEELMERGPQVKEG